MDEAQSAVLSDFMSITGVDNAAAATVVLDATAWVLEDAVNLQFATGGDFGGGPTGAPPAGAAGAAPTALPDEEEVRAPLPVVRDRLYGDYAGPQAIMPRFTRCASEHAGPSRRRRAGEEPLRESARAGPRSAA